MNRVNAPDGTPLVFDAYEPAGARVAVLFLHDWAGSAGQWRDTGAQLRAAGFAAYALDQRGHGRSGGQKGHLSRFSQLLGDLQVFRRAVRRTHDVPQVIWGHGFGGLIALRYLETQPGEPPVAAIVSNPLLAARRRPAVWKRIAAKFADLWPTLPTSAGASLMTAGARAELQWAQDAIVADHARIECRLLFVLGGADNAVNTAAARTFAERLGAGAEIRWHAEMTHDLLPTDRVLNDVLQFLAETRSSGPVPTTD